MITVWRQKEHPTCNESTNVMLEIFGVQTSYVRLGLAIAKLGLGFAELGLG